MVKNKWITESPDWTSQQYTCRKFAACYIASATACKLLCMIIVCHRWFLNILFVPVHSLTEFVFVLSPILDKNISGTISYRIQPTHALQRCTRASCWGSTTMVGNDRTLKPFFPMVSCHASNAGRACIWLYKTSQSRVQGAVNSHGSSRARQVSPTIYSIADNSSIVYANFVIFWVLNVYINIYLPGFICVRLIIRKLL